MTFDDPQSLLTRATRSLWFRPAIYGALALSVLLLAPTATPLLPDEIAEVIGLDGVYDLLGVLANTLLAVAIFSLGIIASSMRAAAGAATPRARPLLLKDRTAQNAISTFIGGFIFAVLGIVGLSTNYYSDASRVILFFATCLVILTVIVALIRWIGRLSKLGDVSEVIDLVEDTASQAFRDLAKTPNLGGHLLQGEPYPFAIMYHGFGFVQAINSEKLSDIAEELDIRLHLLVRAGSYVNPTRAILATDRQLNEECQDRLREAVVMGGDRSFEQDPRFGLIVLSEIASRALSPGVNDPGTAIDVIDTVVRVIARWSDARAKDPEIAHPRLHVVPLAVGDLIEDGFRWIARDGAAQLEVQLRLQKALAALAAHDPLLAAPARSLSHEALERARRAMDLPADFARLEQEVSGSFVRGT